MDVQSIGVVNSKFKEPADPEEMRESNSTIIVDSEYEDGLYRIEENQYLQVIFYFDRSDGYELIAQRRKGGEKGLFASRSPRRPSPVGVSTVELVDRKGNELEVKGLDALDGTPVVDIKPHAPVCDNGTSNK